MCESLGEKDENVYIILVKSACYVFKAENDSGRSSQHGSVSTVKGAKFFVNNVYSGTVGTLVNLNKGNNTFY